MTIDDLDRAEGLRHLALSTITGGAGHLHGDELDVDADGRLTIVASREEQPGRSGRLHNLDVAPGELDERLVADALRTMVERVG